MGFFFFEKIICGYDGIGRRAGFRFLCLSACGFESRVAQKSKSLELTIVSSKLFSYLFDKFELRGYYL